MNFINWFFKWVVFVNGEFFIFLKSFEMKVFIGIELFVYIFNYL